MKNKHVGYLIIAISALILIIVYSFNQALANIVAQSCSHGITCPMYNTLGVQKAVSYALTALVALAGVIIAFVIKEKPVKEVHIHHKTKQTTFPSAEEQDKITKDLPEEEAKLMQELFKEHGKILQSILPSKLETNKVKVTRILDSLEQKGLIERKRKGMSNLIVFKH